MKSISANPSNIRKRQRSLVRSGLIVSVFVGVALLGGVLFTEKAGALVASGGPGCAQFSAAIYAINDTASYAAGQDPYGNPVIPAPPPAREQIPVNVTASISSSPSCVSPSLPHTYTTGSCPRGTPPPCPPAPLLWGAESDASGISLSPPLTTIGNGSFGLTTLTFIGATWELGAGQSDPSTGLRNFPSSAQLADEPGTDGFRLILHYTDCSDPSAPAAFCPAPPPPPPALGCSLTAADLIIPPGGSTTLSWDTTGSPTSATIDQKIGAVTPATSGSISVSPITTTSYLLTVSRPGDSFSCPETVTVSGAIECTLNTSDSSIDAGDPATLTWTTSNGPTAANLNPGGAVDPAGGNMVVSPATTTQYVLTVSRAGQPDFPCSATINVTPASSGPGGNRRLGPWDSIINLPPVL